MPAPHPLSSLYAAGPPFDEAARDKIRQALAEHGGDVRATAKGLTPPVHETTLHDWISEWEVIPGRRPPRGKKSTEGQKKGLAKSSRRS